MHNDLRIAVIGLDTSHAVEFTRLLQSPDIPESERVHGAEVVTCLRFPTPFLGDEGLDKRQAQMESWGVKVTRDFAEAVDDCNAIMVEINDPSYHLEYFTKCADLGKPVFLDKPLADNMTNGMSIARIAGERGVRLFSSSSLRFARELESAILRLPNPMLVSMYGPLGNAPSGSSIVWYGVHTFEMLQRAMGCGAKSVHSYKDRSGVVAVVEYDDERRGVVELSRHGYSYGGSLRRHDDIEQFVVDFSNLYADQLREVVSFFKGDDPPVTLEDTLEVMGMLHAAEVSSNSGASEPVGR